MKTSSQQSSDPSSALTENPASKSAVQFDRVDVALGGKAVLRELDLEVAEGEHVLLVGPSGCGKTTLLRSIAGFVTPSKGCLKLHGEPVAQDGKCIVPPERRGVGMLFQGAALWPHMSAAKTLRFTLKRSGQSATKARIEELLACVHLEDKASSRPAELSGGEKQRLALARALAIKPRLLLLDEPLGPLDADLRGELLVSLDQLHQREGWTILHVTHDPTEASAYASRVLTLRDGRLIKSEHVRASASDTH